MIVISPYRHLRATHAIPPYSQATDIQIQRSFASFLGACAPHAQPVYKFPSATRTASLDSLSLGISRFDHPFSSTTNSWAPHTSIIFHTSWPLTKHKSVRQSISAYLLFSLKIGIDILFYPWQRKWISLLIILEQPTKIQPLVPHRYWQIKMVQNILDGWINHSYDDPFLDTWSIKENQDQSINLSPFPLLFPFFFFFK